MIFFFKLPSIYYFFPPLDAGGPCGFDLMPCVCVGYFLKFLHTLYIKCTSFHYCYSAIAGLAFQSFAFSHVKNSKVGPSVGPPLWCERISQQLLDGQPPNFVIVCGRYTIKYNYLYQHKLSQY